MGSDTASGRRLKHVRLAGRFPRIEDEPAPCSLLYSDDWEAFWRSDAAFSDFPVVVVPPP